METVDTTRFILAFFFVIGLIGILAFVLKRYGSAQKIFGMKEDGGRIQVLEVRWLDPRRRVVLLRRDNVEHLLLLADGREVVIESGVVAKESDTHA